MAHYLPEMKERLSYLFACWSADLSDEQGRRERDVAMLNSYLAVAKDDKRIAQLKEELKGPELILKVLPLAMMYRKSEMGREMHRRRQRMEREVADLTVAWEMGDRGVKERLMEAEMKLEEFNALEANKGWDILMARMG